VATRDDVEATGLHFALVFGLDRVRALGQSQQENRSLGWKVEHRAAAAVDNAQVHVGNEFVLPFVVLRERHPHRKLRAHVTHEIGLLHADSTVQIPDLALAWLGNRAPATPKFGMAGAQPLFDRQAFANQCQDACNTETGFVVWTGYQPPEGAYSGQAAEAKYVSDLRNSNGSSDVDNQFVEGAYLGMNLLVKALQTVGPDLTRQRLKAVLDTMTFTSGLTKPLAWTPGHHFANDAAMGWRLNYSNGAFSGFSAVTKFEVDPWLAQDLHAGG